MNIQHAILGLLRRQPMSGYDLKKAMQKSPLLYWSGNNSQIYRALAELEAEGQVLPEIRPGEAAAAKKLYSLTDAGLTELRRLSLSYPEAPEIRKTFLMQLEFGVQPTRAELTKLLGQYAEEVRGMAFAVDTDVLPGDATDYEKTIHALVMDNIRQVCTQEFAWIDRVRAEALPLAAERSIEWKGSRDANSEDGSAVDPAPLTGVRVEHGGVPYLRIATGELREKQDGLALVTLLWEHELNRVLLPEACLTDAFLQLNTGVAGEILQKMANYNVRVAVVLEESRTKGRFGDFAAEANRGRMFHAFRDEASAEAWLTKEGS